MKLSNWFVMGTTWLLAAIWCKFVYGDDITCASGLKVGKRVVINSHKNDSGHWFSQVELINKDGKAQRTSMDMDVHEHTFSCYNANGSKNGTTNKSFTTISVTLVNDGTVSPRGDAVPQARFSAVTRILGRKRTLFFSEALVTWDEARRVCLERGMRLAMYSSSNAHGMSRLLYKRRRLQISNKNYAFISTVDRGHDSRGDETASPPALCSAYNGWKVVAIFLPSSCSFKRPFFCERAEGA